MSEIFSTSTEYHAHELTLSRGLPADIVYQGVYYTENPAYIPVPSDFVEAELIGPTVTPGSPLLDGTKLDVLHKLGPGAATPVVVSPGHFTLTAGDHQRWIAVATADEFVIRRPDTVTVT